MERAIIVTALLITAGVAGCLDRENATSGPITLLPALSIGDEFSFEAVVAGRVEPASVLRLALEGTAKARDAYNVTVDAIRVSATVTLPDVGAAVEMQETQYYEVETLRLVQSVACGALNPETFECNGDKTSSLFGNPFETILFGAAHFWNQPLSVPGSHSVGPDGSTLAWSVEARGNRITATPSSENRRHVSWPTAITTCDAAADVLELDAASGLPTSCTTPDGNGWRLVGTKQGTGEAVTVSSAQIGQAPWANPKASGPRPQEAGSSYIPLTLTEALGTAGSEHSGIAQLLAGMAYIDSAGFIRAGETKVGNSCETSPPSALCVRTYRWSIKLMDASGQGFDFAVERDVVGVVPQPPRLDGAQAYTSDRLVTRGGIEGAAGDFEQLDSAHGMMKRFLAQFGIQNVHTFSLLIFSLNGQNQNVATYEARLYFSSGAEASCASCPYVSYDLWQQQFVELLRGPEIPVPA